MDFNGKVLLLVAVICLALIIIGLAIRQQPVPPDENDTENMTMDDTIPPPSPEKPDVWTLLNNPNVEMQCLKQARQFASEQDLPSFFIMGCSCEANESADVKSYDCVISAADGDYQVDATCVKADRRCIFTSLGGAIVYTFDEMEKLMID
jgi:hypothetical protein